MLRANLINRLFKGIITLGLVVTMVVGYGFTMREVYASNRFIIEKANYQTGEILQNSHFEVMSSGIDDLGSTSLGSTSLGSTSLGMNINFTLLTVSQIALIICCLVIFLSKFYKSRRKE